MFQLNQQSTSTTGQEINGIIDNSPIYVTSLSEPFSASTNPPASSVEPSSGRRPSPKSARPADAHDADLLLTQRLSEPVKPADAAVDLKPASKVALSVDQKKVEQKAGAEQKPSTGASSEPCSEARVRADSLDIKVPTPSDRRASSPFQNGRTEVLIGADENKFKTTAVVESNNNKLGVDPEVR